VLLGGREHRADELSVGVLEHLVAVRLLIGRAQQELGGQGEVHQIEGGIGLRGGHVGGGPAPEHGERRGPGDGRPTGQQPPSVDRPSTLRGQRMHLAHLPTPALVTRTSENPGPSGDVGWNHLCLV
jgi:hypothetical protein